MAARWAGLFVTWLPATSARPTGTKSPDAGRTCMSESGYAVFYGLDIGKIAHHAAALDPAGKRLHDAALPQDEQRLRQLSASLQSPLPAPHPSASPWAPRGIRT